MRTFLPEAGARNNRGRNFLEQRSGVGEAQLVLYWANIGVEWLQGLSTDDTIEVVPLGGLGEFGMNIMAIRYRGSIVVVDVGMMFPRDDLLGVDLVVPEFTYLLEHRQEEGRGPHSRA